MIAQVLPDFLAIYDSCSGFYTFAALAILALGTGSLAACIAAYVREMRQNAALRWPGYVADREHMLSRLARLCPDMRQVAVSAAFAASAPVYAEVAPVSPVSAPVSRPVREVIGAGCAMSVDSLRPTLVIPVVTPRGIRYRSTVTGRFVRYDATNCPV